MDLARTAVEVDSARTPGNVLVTPMIETPVVAAADSPAPSVAVTSPTAGAAS